jgi:predicted ester cyclase
MTAEEIKSKFRRVWGEFNKGNLDPQDELYAADWVLHQPPTPDVQGLAVWKQTLVDWRTAYPDVQWTIEELIVEGDSVVMRYNWHGTNTGESTALPFPPTGKQIVVRGCGVNHIVGGKVVEAWVFMDMLGMMQQLGLIPAMG